MFKIADLQVRLLKALTNNLSSTKLLHLFQRSGTEMFLIFLKWFKGCSLNQHKMDHLAVVTTQWGFIFVNIAGIIAQKYVIAWEKCLLFLHRGLADTKQTGKLNEEQFALAMHLIQQKVNKGIDPPSTLTPDMIPPSERSASSAMGFVSSAYTVFQPLLHLSVCQYITICFFFF